MTTPTDRIRTLMVEEPTESFADAVDALCDSHDLFLEHVRAYGPERFRADFPDVAAWLANIGDRVERSVSDG